jgi:hypothetical protein
MVAVVTVANARTVKAARSDVNPSLARPSSASVAGIQLWADRPNHTGASGAGVSTICRDRGTANYFCKANYLRHHSESGRIPFAVVFG